ncbi:MAG TPA: DnaJ domain-containing protein [Blastocatellia bacterium]|nr:DnaJ domain-containing protein [Blastocatellia bacterium]HKE06095.1 DnaJ domain-containing protein [Blastocatellia bacterium]
MGDLYAVLGVKRTANSSEIKSAYRRLARKYHPDVNSDPTAQSKFAQINEAYHTLINPEGRKTYDRTGSVSSAAYARRADSAAAKAARRAYYQQRADHIVNEWLEREREETRARGKAVFTTVTLFVSTFFAAIFSGLFALDSTIWRDILHVTLILLFVIGVRHLYASLKEHFDRYTYRQPRMSVTRPVKKSNKRFKRSDALAFVIIGYLVSVGAGVLIRLLMESFSARPLDNATIIADAFFYALLCPPIAVMIVDKMHSFNL